MKYRPELPKDGWYTYGLFLDGVPFYVGKGSGKRAFNHFYPSYANHGANPWKSNIINKHRESIEVIVLIHHSNDEDAFKLEEFLISSYGLRKHGGVLVNQTLGGEGTSGVVVSSELGLRRGSNIRKFSEETFKTALEQYYFHGLSQKEVCKILGIHQTQFSQAIRGKTKTLLKALEEFKSENQSIDFENYSRNRVGIYGRKVQHKPEENI
ncbi:MAG: hypothetical protein ACRC6V_01670 [Bacteroidales bacterium]